MTEKIRITERWEYDYAKSRGHEPLLFHAAFDVAFELRMELQRELFPKYTPENNGKFYRWVWDNWPDQEHKCEETQRPIANYSAVHISHIITRNSRPEMAYDGRNVNLLLAGPHKQWEDRTKRITMRIYPRNISTIEQLQSDYLTIKRYRA